MHYDKLEDLIKSLKDLKQVDPECYIEVKDFPVQLRVGFKVTSSNGHIIEYTLPFVRLKTGDAKLLSEIDTKVIKEYFDARVSFHKLEQEYIKIFTG